MILRFWILLCAVRFGLAAAAAHRQSVRAQRATGLVHHEDRDCRLCAFTRDADRAEEAARHRLIDAVREAER